MNITNQNAYMRHVMFSPILSASLNAAIKMATPRSRKIELTRAQMEQFIGYYHSHECLWNVSSPFYSRRDHRQAAYTSIATLMGGCITSDQVPLKISAVRTYYAKELRKQVHSSKSGAGREDLYQSPWEWFPLLDPFLRSQVTQKSSISNMESSDMPETDSNNIANDHDDAINTMPDVERTEDMDMINGDTGRVKPTTTTTMAPSQSTTTMAPSTSTTTMAPSTSTTTMAPSTSTPKKRKAQNIQESLIKTIQSIESRREERANCNESLFGKFIASEVANIKDEKRRRMLKFQIQQLIFQFQDED